jgi:hypothetical protein
VAFWLDEKNVRLPCEITNKEKKMMMRRSLSQRILPVVIAMKDRATLNVGDISPEPIEL